MSGANQVFSQNYEINSLAMAHSGAKVKQFNVTRWLQEGDLIYLDDKNPTKDFALQVILTPGHTPDSMALWFAADQRLFTGDTFYPFTAVHLDSIGSSPRDYRASVEKINAFLDAAQKESAPTAPAPAPAPISPPKDDKVSQFLNSMGLDEGSVSFDVNALLQLCDGRVEQAVDMYALSLPSSTTVEHFDFGRFLNLGASEITQMTGPAPPRAKPMAVTPIGPGIHLSCGHVEANLSPVKVQELLAFLSVIASGGLPPAYTDGEYAEYSR